MKRKQAKDSTAASAQGEFVSAALNQMSPELISQMAEDNPEFVVSILAAMGPKAMADAINRDPDIFAGIFGAMPRRVMRVLLKEEPDFTFDMLRFIDPEILMDMMGLKE